MSLYDILDDALAKSPAKNSLGDAIVSGVMIGVVLENNNEDFPGMVKVEIITREKDKNITDWVKVVTNYGGKEWGSYIMPEIGDEVMLAFLDGNISRPFVIGSIYLNDSKRLSESFNKNNYIKSFKTKAGTEVTFTDEPNKEKIEVKTPKQTALVIDDENEVVTIRNKNGKNMLSIDIKNGAISIVAEKKISLKAGSGAEISMDGSSGSINIQGKQVSIDAQQQVSIKGTQAATVEGAQTTIKGSAKLEISSTGILVLKGNPVKIN